MKVAFISVSRDGTGYAHAANDMMLALDAAGVDVVSLWVSLSGNPLREIPEQIKLFEKKDLDDVDAVIQYILPQYYVNLKDIPSIGAFMYETSSFRGSNWQYLCNIMDEIWVFTPEMKKACLDSGVKTKVREVNFAHDPSKYEIEYPKLMPELTDRFVFYTISELSYRKNITSLIAAYYNAFSLKDNVVLVIKGFQDAMTPKETEVEFDKTIQTLRGAMKKGPKHKWAPIVLITEWLSEEQIMMLHSTGDCFITLSRGEGECIPLFEAAAMGNRCIAPSWNGPKKLLEGEDVHYLIDGMMKPVLSVGNTMPNLYLSDELWFDPSAVKTTLAMIDARYNPIDESMLGPSAERLKHRFSYAETGQQLKKHLENLIGQRRNESRILCKSAN